MSDICKMITEAFKHVGMKGGVCPVCGRGVWRGGGAA
jgi:hypothetical protein